MSKYYSIAKGREIGIFTNWDIAKSYVDGYPGAKFKSFTTRESAQQYLELNGIKFENSLKPLDIISSSPKLIISSDLSKNGQNMHTKDVLYIYTDGSHRNSIGGIGLVFLYNNKIIYKISAKIQEIPTTNNRAELFAIYVAMYNLNNIKVDGNITSITIYSDSEYSVNSYTKNIKIWEKNNYKTVGGEPVKNLDIILPTWNILKDTKLNVNILWVKSHADNEYNNLADKLATEGRDS